MAISLRLAPFIYKNQKKKKKIEKHAEISLKESLMANIMGLSFPRQGSDLLLVSMHKF